MSLPIYDNILTFEQFISISESIKGNTGYNTEYTDGKIFYFSPSAKHSKSSNNIVKILNEQLPKNCVAISELHIKFNDSEYKVPDVSVFCGNDIKEKYEKDILYLDMPKLIFEILSESTGDNDRNLKMKLYANKGIEEYLIVDYKNKSIKQYCLNGNSYILNKEYNDDDVCILLLYPHIKFVTSKIFELFM